MTLHAGDLVECIDNKSVEAYLTRGNRYIIDDVCVEEKCVYLSNVNKFSFLSSRFRLVEPTTQLSEQSAWPSVPVDPECIPDGWRAVEVTKNVAGKDVQYDEPNKPTACSQYPRLVIERITPPLAKPDFPEWLNPDWWIAMDKQGTWCVYDELPAKHPSMFGWHGDVTVMLHADTYTDAMRAVPPNLWDEACWRIGN